MRLCYKRCSVVFGVLLVPAGGSWYDDQRGGLSNFVSYASYSLVRQHYKDSSEAAADTKCDGQTSRSNTYFEVAELHFKAFARAGSGEMRIWMEWTYMKLQMRNINSAQELCACIIMYLPPVQTVQSNMIHSSTSEIFNYILLNGSIFILHQNLQ